MKAVRITTYVSTETEDWYVSTLRIDERDGSGERYSTRIYTYDKMWRTIGDLQFQAFGHNAHLFAVAHLMEHGTPPKEEDAT